MVAKQHQAVTRIYRLLLVRLCHDTMSANRRRSDLCSTYHSEFIDRYSAFLLFCYSAILRYMNTILTITSRGVISLPAALRRAVGLKANDQLIAEATPDGILLRPAITVPLEIYSDSRINEFNAGEAELASVLAAKSSSVASGTTQTKKRVVKRKS